MHGLFQRVGKKIVAQKLFARGDQILLAVSGGADSVVLLKILTSLAAENRWRISVAHFNHQLRGRASDADEKLVRQTAKKMRLKFFGERADVKKFAAREKISIEMAARKLRHAFFARVAQKNKIKKIALAHHADDQVELFFLRLLRGAGGEGLAGMKSISPSPANPKISLARPLLDFSKDDLLEFARESKIHFRDDASNFSSDFLRNRIRNELLPLLKNYQPALAKTVLRAMEISRVEAEFVADAAQRWLARPEIAFEKLSQAVQRKVLQQQLLDLEIAPDFELIESLRKFSNQFVSVASKISVARNAAGKIRLREESKLKFQSDELAVNLDKAAETIFAGTKFDWRISKKSAIRNPQSVIQKEFFDADKVGGEIVLRHWRAGDRFQPIGLKSPAKLQDLFTNAKIAAEQRRGVVLAATISGEIFWVEGLRISENFKLTRGTRRQLVWEWVKSPV